jgi:hypothetical protein
MPARREYTPEELAARLEQRRRQNREAQRRFRARDADHKHDAPQENSVLPSIVSLTPPTPARHSVPLKTPPPPKGGPPSVRAAPKPNKSGDVIDLLRAAGVPDVLSEADHRHIKTSRLSAAQIGEAYVAAFNGEWGGDWLQEHLNMANVLGRYAGYLAWKQRAPTPPRTNASTANGVVHQPNSLKPNRRPDYVPVFTHDLERIDPGVAQRALAQAAGRPLKEKLAAARNGRA